MPGGDQTGPMGLGPMTGRADGFCAGYPVPGYANSLNGRGYFGRGRGFGGRGGGRGWRNCFNVTGLTGWERAGFGFSGPVAPTATAEQQLEGLKQRAEFLQNTLTQINERIGQLEKENCK